MIYTMAREVAARLQARSYPVDVLYLAGRVNQPPQRVGSSVGVDGYRVTFARDRKGADSFSAFPGTQGNPAAAGVRGVAVVVEVYGRSPKRGGRGAEDEHVCDQLVDAVFDEVQRWCREAGAGAPEWVQGRLLGPEDFRGQDAPAGEVYRLQFRVARAILRRDYAGNAEPTGSIAASAGTFTALRVTRDGDSYEEIDLT